MDGPDRPQRTRVLGGWRLLEFGQVGSTNTVAAGLAPWEAVRADTQTEGRGRFSRTWISDLGGLWLSAVVPMPSDPLRARLLPLAAGWALFEAVASLGVAGARLRWPNDLMVAERKLAGLLVESPAAGRAVVGIGINVANRPGARDPALEPTATRLADLVAHPPSLETLADVVLAKLRYGVEHLSSGGFPALKAQMDAMWGPPRRVQIDLDGIHKAGLFLGVDSAGRLVLEESAAVRAAYEPHQVRLLREV